MTHTYRTETPLALEDPASLTPEAAGASATPSPAGVKPRAAFTKEQVDAVLNALDPFWTRAIGEGKSLTE